MSDTDSTVERDDEFHELIAGWLGEAPAPERAAHLLRRLREDAAFRAAVVGEMKMHGMLRTALASEPRWLEVQAELGLLESAPPTLAARVSTALFPLPSAHGRRRRLVWTAGLAAALVLGMVWFFTGAGNPTPDPAEQAFAVVVKSDHAVARSAERRPIEPQTVIARGPFALAKGRLSLALLNGVSLHLEGPAELDLVSDERIVCRQGRLRVYVPPGAEGFVVETPGAVVTDLGTEFGVEVGSGSTEVVVYRGQAEVALLSAGGQPQRSQVIGEREAWRINPSAGSMQSVAPREQLPAPSLVLPDLRLADDYATRIQNARPRHYWRGPSLTDGVVADAGVHPTPLLAEGGIRRESDGSFSFRAEGGVQYLLSRDTWEPPADGFAIELWFVSEAFRSSILAILPTLVPPADLGLLELTHRHRTRPVRPGEVRFLYRWPPGGTAGINVFSSDTYTPHRWHHLVAQRRGQQLELYLDGHLAGATSLSSSEPTTTIRPLFGRRRDRSIDYDPRQFEGRMAEIALYDRSLSPAEITAHANAHKRP